MSQHLKCFHIWHSSMVCRGIEGNGWLSNNLFWHQNTSNQRKVLFAGGPHCWRSPVCITKLTELLKNPNILKSSHFRRPQARHVLVRRRNVDIQTLQLRNITSDSFPEVWRNILFRKLGDVWGIKCEALRTNGNPSSRNESANTIWEFSREAKETLKMAKLNTFDRMV